MSDDYATLCLLWATDRNDGTLVAPAPASGVAVVHTYGPVPATTPRLRRLPRARGKSMVKTQPSARVLLDSVSPDGARVTTMEIVMHRFVLAEFNTHRAFSRNSASSRAIPVRKMLERVEIDPAVPIAFASEQRGMQSGEPLDLMTEFDALKIWDAARLTACTLARQLAELRVHKSVVNRLLEPFSWHTVIVTADAEGYENFFAQRCSPLAQPELRAAAEAMQDAWFASNPRRLDYGQWHTPFIDDETREAIDTHLVQTYGDVLADHQTLAQRVSVARCARVSYLTHHGYRDVAKDLELYDKLVSADPPHWSPLEHVCRPIDEWDEMSSVPVVRDELRGNLRGWVQLRHIIASKVAEM